MLFLSICFFLSCNFAFWSTLKFVGVGVVVVVVKDFVALIHIAISERGSTWVL